MKVLLIGPHPPPHGGISVHVAGIHQQLTDAGITCRVLDTGAVHSGIGLMVSVFHHALQGWTLHLHTNGHNVKSWLLALVCGLAGAARNSSILTLHSGLLPGYLKDARSWRRNLAELACSLYRQIICVSPEIHGALMRLGVDDQRVEILPAFLSTHKPQLPLQPGLLAWTNCHRPLFTTVLFFRPEYGFNLLIDALVRLNRTYPSMGCLVMGSGEQRPDAEHRVRDAGLQENVMMLGDVDHDTCLALISLCDVFLRPTLQDGDSISVREALALGVPVVASRAGMRPPGAILFRPGDVKEMLAKIDLAFVSQRPPRADSPGCMDRLIEIYQQGINPKAAYV